MRVTAHGVKPGEPAHLELGADPRWQVTQRILASEHFRKANRLREFLLYVVERSLDDRVSEITEQQIGVHVFGRKPHYNASEDNVVRSQARLLRLKLESYFAKEGAAEDLVLSIPRGTYVPVFEGRTNHVLPVPAKWKRGVLAVVVCAAAIAVTAVSLRPTWLPGNQEEAWSRNRFWQKAFANATKSDGILVVPADSTFALTQEILGRRITLAEFLSKSYLPEWESAARRFGLPGDLPLRNYTVFDSAMNISRIFKMGTRLNAGLKLRSARDVGYRDFRLASAILLGSPKDNPWMELVEAKLPFRAAWDADTNILSVVNLNPLAGERKVYYPEGPSFDKRRGRLQYATIALIPNDAGTGSVLVVGGTDIAATEFSGDLVSDPNLFKNVLAPRLKSVLKSRDIPHFQALISGRESEGRLLEPSIVAVRCWE